MTEVYGYGGMLDNDDDDSPEKCRQRRRRRIQMRRTVSISSAASVAPNPTEGSCCFAEGKAVQTGETETTDYPTTSASSGEEAESSAAPHLPSFIDQAPAFGTMSVSGRSREMEDAISVRTNLCRPALNRLRPVHFFGLFDGHGGSHVAALCRERMHLLMEEELMRVVITAGSGSGSNGSSGEEEQPQETQGPVVPLTETDGWGTAMRRCFKRMDEAALNTCACGSIVNECGCHPVGISLTGSTAVVAVLTPEHIFVANCGDSRAVLCRGRRTLPLSFDHKPDREDELARIKVKGGRVIYVNGARVEGILAMSRAIGDKYLKPIITSEPEISMTKRDPQDEFLIIASDGLWDVLSSDMACEVARKCLRDKNPIVASRDLDARPWIGDGGAGVFPSRSASAAALLTRLALGRRSLDNISVIVVDLKRRQGEDSLEKVTSAGMNSLV